MKKAHLATTTLAVVVTGDRRLFPSSSGGSRFAHSLSSTAAPSPTLLSLPRRTPRIELSSFRTIEELEDRVSFLVKTKNGFSRFNLVNKSEDDDMLGWLDATLDVCLRCSPTEVHEGCGPCSVCVHHSLKYNPGRCTSFGRDGGGGFSEDAADATYRAFVHRALEVKQRENRAFSPFCRASDSPSVELLLVSGFDDGGTSNATLPLDSVECLRRLAKDYPPPPPHAALASTDEDVVHHPEFLPDIGVAFNPYFSNSREIETERQRLRWKLETKLVNSVWLQFGSDVELLRSSLEWMRGELLPPLGILPTDSSKTGLVTRFRIVGSVFLPTNKMQERLRRKGIGGVFLSETYLSGGLHAAERITRDILDLYDEFNVEKVVQLPAVRTTDDIILVKKILNLS